MAKARISAQVQLVMKETMLNGSKLVPGDFIVTIAGHLLGMSRREALEEIQPASKDARVMIALAEKMDE